MILVRIAARSRLGAAVVAMLVFAGTLAGAARATTVTVTPRTQGSGSIAGTARDGGILFPPPPTRVFGCAPITAPTSNATVTTCDGVAASGVDFVGRHFAGAISMTATPAAGWAFQSWSGCPTTPSGASCAALSQSAGDTAATVTAVFAEIVPVTFQSKPPAFTNNTRPPVSFSSTVAGTTFSCQVDAGPVVQPCASPFTPPSALSNTTHSITVTGFHNGNPSVSPAVVSFTVDTAAPTAALDPTSGPGEGALQATNTETFKFNASEPSTFQCRLDAAAFADCASPTTLTRLTAGLHAFAVRALDRAGNLSAPVSRSWTVAASDDDDDGFNARVDCNDANPAIHPGATDVPDNLVDENCDGADAHTPATLGAVAGQQVEKIVIVLSYFSKASTKTTRFTTLRIKNIPLGATVTVTCKGKGCPKGLTGKGYVKRNAFGTVSLAKFIKQPIRITARITVVVSKPGAINAVKTITLRKRKAPVITTKCQPPGAKTPVAC